MVAALVTVASSQVSRRNRRVLWAVVWLVAAALARASAALRTVRPLQPDARGSVPFVGQGADGAVFVKAVGRDQRDADLLFRVGRWLAFREVGDEAPLATAKQQIEHEAYLLLAAARAGARVPELITTAGADDGMWLLAERRVEGTDASEASLDDAVLEDLWRQVATLRAARIAHRDLRLANVVVGDDRRAWLVDFGFAQAGATDDQLARDVAELLASTATAAGAVRAVSAAVATIGAVALQQAAPFLQPLALSTATGRRLAAQPGVLDDLHDALAGLGVRIAPRPLLRVHLRPAMLVAVAGGGYVTPSPAHRRCGWSWRGGGARPHPLAVGRSGCAGRFGTVPLRGARPDRCLWPSARRRTYRRQPVGIDVRVAPVAAG